MPTEFKLPDIGEGLEEAEIIKWLVKEGDVVKADQNIVQVETDKAVADLPAPVGGKILKINFKEGDTVKVGEVLCVIGSTEEKVKESKKIEKREIRTKQKEDFEVEEKPHAETMKGVAATRKVLAAPAVRKLARNLRIDLSTIKGSGSEGMILKEDLEKAKPGFQKEIETKTEIPQQMITIKKKYDQFGYIERIPLKGIRKTIAQNMMHSLQNSAQLTAMEDIDISELWKIREKEKKDFEKKDIKLTFLPFVIKASIAALKENPILNSSLENDEIIIRKYYNIGVAVETDVGLMVPVIKIADSKSITKIAKEISELAEKARNRTIDIMDMKGSTFTITNYGSIGGNYGTPILNPGEAAILGLGRIFDRVVLDEKTGKLRNIKILPISLTFDHRILDGAQAARFLESLKLFLEDPDHLFMEIE